MGYLEDLNNDIERYGQIADSDINNRTNTLDQQGSVGESSFNIYGALEDAASVIPAGPTIWNQYQTNFALLDTPTGPTSMSFEALGDVSVPFTEGDTKLGDLLPFPEGTGEFLDEWTPDIVKDKLGMFATGVSETSMIGTVADISTGGQLHEALGNDSWADMTWGDAAFKALGQYAGFVGGMGIAKKVAVNPLFKTLGIGSRSLGKDIKKKIMTPTVLDDGWNFNTGYAGLIREGSKAVTKATKTAKRGTVWHAQALRGSIKKNPLGEPTFHLAFRKNIQGSLRKYFPKATDNELDEIYKLVSI